MKRGFRLLPAWMLTMVSGVAIIWLTLSPRPLGDTGISLFPGADKLAHAILFGGFAVCMLVDWRRYCPCRRNMARRVVLSVAFSFLFGIVIEFMQGWMNLGRSFDVADIGADFVGCILTGLLWILLMPRQ